MKKFKLIIIDARKWFDRTYGNTYHSVTVTVKHARKEDLVLRCDFAYGYGEQYLQTAHDLHSHGVICIPVGSIEPSASVYDYQLEFFHAISPFSVNS